MWERDTFACATALIVAPQMLRREPMLPGVFEILLRIDFDVAAGRIDVA